MRKKLVLSHNHQSVHVQKTILLGYSLTIVQFDFTPIGDKQLRVRINKNKTITHKSKAAMMEGS